jgi:hypothetical protein
MINPLFKVYHFPQYMRPRTVAVFFTLADAETFALNHGHEYAANGCYVGACYPNRKAAA